MKIAVIGASGRTGRYFIDAALAAGHQVTAGTRHETSFDKHKNLQTIKCDVLSESDVYRLVKGQDAVVSLIGHGRKSPPQLQTDAMKNLVKVMNSLNVKRLISLTGTGVRMPHDRITVIDTLMNMSVAAFDPKRVRDGIEHAKILKSSGLDWTLLRVLKMTNRPAGKFNLSLHGPAKILVSRASVAQAILQVLQNNTFVRLCPIIGP